MRLVLLCAVSLLASCGEAKAIDDSCERDVLARQSCLKRIHLDLVAIEKRLSSLATQKQVLPAECPACECQDAGVRVEGSPKTTARCKPPAYAEGVRLLLDNPFWVELAFGTGDFKKGEHCVAWTGGSLRTEEWRSSTRWLACYFADDDEHGGTLCPDGAEVYFNPVDYANAGKDEE